MLNKRTEEASRESVVAEVREIAARIGVDTLRREDFDRESSISLYQVYSLFADDGWRGVLEAAGLRVPFQNVAIPDETLLEEFHRIVIEMGVGSRKARQFHQRRKGAVELRRNCLYVDG